MAMLAAESHEGTSPVQLTTLERLLNQTAEVARQYSGDCEETLPEFSAAPTLPPGRCATSHGDWVPNYGKEPHGSMTASFHDDEPPKAVLAEPETLAEDPDSMAGEHNSTVAVSEGEPLAEDELVQSESERRELDEALQLSEQDPYELDVEEAIRRSQQDPHALDLEEAMRLSQQDPQALDLEEAMRLSLDQALWEEDRARASWLEDHGESEDNHCSSREKSPRSVVSVTHSDASTVCTEDSSALGQSLFDAVEAEDYEATERILAFPGTPINWRGFNGRTPLLAACVKGNQRITSLLIANGADVNQPNDVRVAPLHVAAAGGHADCIRELLKAGANRRAVDSKGMSALQWARSTGHKAASKMLSSDFSFSSINLRQGIGGAVYIRA